MSRFLVYQHVVYTGKTMPVVEHGARGMVSDRNLPGSKLSPGWLYVYFFNNRAGTLEIRERDLEAVEWVQPGTVDAVGQQKTG